MIGSWIFFLELFCIYPIYSSNVVFEMRTGFRQISALDGKMVCHKSIQASPFLIIIRNDFNKSNIPISILISCMKLFLTLIFSNEVLVAWQRMAEVPKSCTVFQKQDDNQEWKLDNKQYRNFQDKELKLFFFGNNGTSVRFLSGSQTPTYLYR